jgi:starch synthase (maltosyl-transferring)
VAELGFDVLYLPPVHPIGVTHRKGRNNATVARPGDPGSPWAIGDAGGGHTAIDPGLGTLEDFEALRIDAEARGIELALDLAFQCSPDHPWVTEHPGWFARRTDGSIRYAENPPKRYEDVLPLDFANPDWRGLWTACLDVVRTWIGRGVRIFRVDNPHTKPFAFWAWLLADVARTDPDVLFLAEAFTRPAVMDQLAKIGFHQSYTYFTWRETRYELEEYFTELSQGPQRDFFRPNAWPNTPDILPGHLQRGGRAMFVTRLVLAAGLAANYGIYGPAFELGEHVAREPGTEEYLDSEKYEVRHWDLDARHSLRDVVARVNAIRRRHAAFHHDTTLHFHRTDNDRFVCWSKRDPRSRDAVLCIVNLDPDFPQAGWTDLDLEALGIGDAQPFRAVDLLGGAAYTWRGPRNYVRLDPKGTVAHVFAIRLQDGATA